MGDGGGRWYYPAEAFDTVYAVSDLHGDLDVAIVLMRDVLRVVGHPPDGGSSTWRWIAPPRTCVVVCGDVVDRSRSARRGGPQYGENDRQSELPDDLCLLRLLNHWAHLARVSASGCRLLRLLGNHEVAGATVCTEYVSEHSLALLQALETHSSDPCANRCASFATPGAAFHDAIWYRPSVRLLVQIGPYVFVHAGLSTATATALEQNGGNVQALCEEVHAVMTGRRPEGLSTGVSDVLQSRAFAVGAPCPALLAAYVLRRWNAVLGVAARALVIGHNTTTPAQCAEHPEDCRVHTALVHESPGALEFDTLGILPPIAITRPEPYAWLNASVDASGRPWVWRLDVGASRACSSRLLLLPSFHSPHPPPPTTRKKNVSGSGPRGAVGLVGFTATDDWTVRPQALRIHMATDTVATLVSRQNVLGKGSRA